MILSFRFPQRSLSAGIQASSHPTRACSGRRWRVRELGAIHPAKRYGFTSTRQPTTFRRSWRPKPSALQRSAARALPGTCLLPSSSKLHMPTSVAADARRWAAECPPEDASRMAPAPHAPPPARTCSAWRAVRAGRRRRIGGGSAAASCGQQWTARASSCPNGITHSITHAQRFGYKKQPPRHNGEGAVFRSGLRYSWRGGRESNPR